MAKIKNYAQFIEDVAKGNFKRNDQNIPIYFLPHPDAKLTSTARKEAWDFCFKEN